MMLTLILAREKVSNIRSARSVWLRSPVPRTESFATVGFQLTEQPNEALN